MSPWTLFACVCLLSSGASAQNTLYSDGGCRIGGHTTDGDRVNVGCGCGQRLVQTSSSTPIEYLNIVGCGTLNGSTGSPAAVSFLTPTGLRQADYVLLNVRSVNISVGHFRLLPVANSVEAAQNPLRRLHVEFVDLVGGLPDGALQGLTQLRYVSMLQVLTITFSQNALSDLPRLRSLVIADSKVTFVNSGMMTRVPQLRQLHVTNTEMQFVRGGAFNIAPTVNSDDNGAANVDDDDDDDSEASTCPTSNTDVAGPATQPTPGIPTLYLADNSFVTLSRSAIMVASMQHVVIIGNQIGDMSLGAITVYLRHVCAVVTALFQFTENDISSDLKKDTIIVSNMSNAAESSPGRARLIIGSNTFQRAVLAPRYLRVRGTFDASSGIAISRSKPSHFACGCCLCDSTQELLNLTLNGTSELWHALFVEPLKTARCAGGGDGDTDAYLVFADTCHPGVAAALQGDSSDSGSGGGGSGRSGGVSDAARVVAGHASLPAVMLFALAAALNA